MFNLDFNRYPKFPNGLMKGMNPGLEWLVWVPFMTALPVRNLILKYENQFLLAKSPSRWFCNKICLSHSYQKLGN